MIYCVIPVFNRKHLLRGCLLSLKEQTYKDYKVIVVDDGSTDGTVEMLKDEFPDVKVLRGDGNFVTFTMACLGLLAGLKPRQDSSTKRR